MRIVMVRLALPVPPVLIALMVDGNVPVAVGVPEINPVEASRPSPAGNPAALKLVGLLLALIW